MKKLLLATAICGTVWYMLPSVQSAHQTIHAALLTAQHAAQTNFTIHCHGHKLPGDKWDVNANSWTDDELQEVNELTGKIKAIFPASKNTAADNAILIDMAQCNGMTHENAIEAMIYDAKTMASIPADGNAEYIVGRR